MSRLNQLLKEAGEIKSRIAGHNARLAYLRTKLEAAKSAPIAQTFEDGTLEQRARLLELLRKYLGLSNNSTIEDINGALIMMEELVSLTALDAKVPSHLLIQEEVRNRLGIPIENLAQICLTRI